MIPCLQGLGYQPTELPSLASYGNAYDTLDAYDVTDGLGLEHMREAEYKRITRACLSSSPPEEVLYGP